MVKVLHRIYLVLPVLEVAHGATDTSWEVVKILVTSTCTPPVVEIAGVTSQGIKLFSYILRNTC